MSLLVFDAFAQLYRIQPTFEGSNFLRTTNFLSLPVLHMPNKFWRRHQVINSTGIEPGKTSLKFLNIQFALFQIFVVYRGYFQFTACTRLNVLSDTNCRSVVKIQSGNSKLGFRICGFFFNWKSLPGTINFNNPVCALVADPITEYGRSIRAVRSNWKLLGEPVSVKKYYPLKSVQFHAHPHRVQQGSGLPHCH